MFQMPTITVTDPVHRTLSPAAVPQSSALYSHTDFHILMQERRGVHGWCDRQVEEWRQSGRLGWQRTQGVPHEEELRGAG